MSEAGATPIADLELGPILGRGATAVVYRARHRLLERDLAVKVWNRAVHGRELRAFLADVGVQWDLSDHPNIVAVRWVDARKGKRPWVATDLYERSLADRLRRGTRLDPDELRALAGDLAAGLAAIHDAGHLHGDVKPANILLRAGRAALGDLATVVGDGGTPGGTPYYLSPERRRGAAPTPADDVYALGRTLERGLGADSDKGFAALVAAATATDQSDRPADALAFLDRLDRLRRPGWVEAGPPDRSRRPVRVGVPPDAAEVVQPRIALTAEVEGARRIALTGAGGVGKTQLAVEAYARTVAAEVALAVWVPARSRTSVAAAYAAAARAADPVAGDTTADAVRRFLALTAAHRSWLVVLDDVLDPAALTGLWPDGPGRLIVTTRDRDVAEAATAEPVEVGPFDPAESIAYVTGELVRRSRAASIDSETAPLTADLGHLPVALAQAVAYLADTRTSCRGYRRLLAARADPAADPLPAGSLALDRADGLAPRGLATPALRLASVLHADGIPESLYSTPAALAHLTKTRGRRSVTVEDARRTLRNLHRLNLVTRTRAGAGTRRVRIHTLVQRAVIVATPAADRPGLVRVAADALAQAWPDPEPDAAVAALFRANLAALVSVDADALWTPEPHPVLVRDGHSLFEAGHHSEAVIAFEALSDQAAARLGPHHPTVLDARQRAAFASGFAGDLEGAAVRLRTVLEEQVRVLGPYDRGVLTTRARLAWVARDSGAARTAIAALEDLLPLCRTVLGADDHLTLRVRHWLALSEAAAGDPETAAAHLEGLVPDVLRVLGPRHPETLSVRYHLVFNRGEIGDPLSALAANERLLPDYVAALGPEHPDTLDTRYEIAYWRGQAGDAPGAVTALRDLLTDRIRILGADHPETLATRHSLGYWTGRAGDAVGAVRLLESLLADRRRVLGPDSPYTMTTRGALARWRGESGDVVGAIAELTDLVADRTARLGRDDPATMTVRENLAVWRGRNGDVTTAVGDLGELVDDRLLVHGPDHPATLVTRRLLAVWTGRSGEPAAAVAALTDVLADQTRVLRPGHAELLATRSDLAHWHKEAAADRDPHSGGSDERPSS